MLFEDYDAEAACDESTAAELRADDLRQRRYRAALSRHPSPRDPDYPGDPQEEEAEAFS